MGKTGPIPKRSDQRVRRNQESDGVETISVAGAYDPPALGFTVENDMTMDIYESVLESGFTHTYEPSDWHVLRFLLFNLDTYLTQIMATGKVNAHALSEIMSGLGTMLLTEGDRRRLRMEIERDSGKQDADVAVLDDYKKMFGM